VTALAAFAFMLLVVAAGVTVLVRLARRTGARTLPAAIAFGVIGTVMLAALAWRLLGEARRLDLLTQLRPSDVTAVAVGTQALDATSVPRVVAALNDCQPLAEEGAHRTLTTARIPLRVDLKSGEPIAFSARYEPKNAAALLSFDSWSGQGESPTSTAGGDMRCPALPGVLAAAGAPLPGYSVP